MKRLTNTLLAACIAGSTVFSSMSFLKAEEQVNLDDGLKNYWNFENVDVGATDIPSNDGKNTNAVLEGSGVAIEQRDEVFGKVLHFGNVNDSCMKISNYINTSGDTSFSMWYRYEPHSGDQSSASTVLLQQDGSGRSLLTLKASGNYHTFVNGQDVVSDATVSSGSWQHITITFDQTNNKVKFYINGVLDCEKALNDNVVNATTALLIGRHKNTNNGDPHAMRGDVDELRIYEKVLTDAEAKAIYAEKGGDIEKANLAQALQDARELYNSGKLDVSAPQAAELYKAILETQALLEQDAPSLDAILAAKAKLSETVALYQAAAPVVLSINMGNVERTIDSDSIFGINHRYAFNGYGSFDPETMQVKEDFQQLYEQVGFGSIRYPGGTISNLFNWKTTLGAKEQRKKQIHGFYNNPGQGGIEPNFGIGEIATFADEVGSEVVYVYSLARGNAQDAADLVEYLNAEVGTNPNGGVDWAAVRAENGHPDPYNIRYFEIGNEMNQGGGDGTASQQYWTAFVSGGSENAYISGGTASFTKQYAVCEEDWNKTASVSDGSANLVRYMRYANVNPKMLDDEGNLVDDPDFVAVQKDSVHVYVGDEEWQIVDSLAAAGANEKVVEIDYATGAIHFGDGTHGAIPAKGQQIYVTYKVDRDGFIEISQALKETTEQINEAQGSSYEAHVYSSYESHSFITKMADLGANDLYDGMTIHPYSGTPTGASNEAWYDDAMKKAENTGIGRVQEYVDMLPEGKVPVISEFGIFRDTNTKVRSHAHAMYIAKVMMEYVRLGSPYIQKHCLVDYYSSGGDSLGPTQQAVIQAVPLDGADTTTGEGNFGFFLTPSAYVFQMMNDGFGDYIVESTFDETLTMNNGVTSLTALASKDDAGNLYITVANVDRTTDRKVRLNVAGMDLNNKEMEIQVLNAENFTDENTLDDPDNVTVETNVTTVPEDQMFTFPAHSFTKIKISADSTTPPVENEAPMIHAENKTLTVGDPFDPLAGVYASDKEDGEILLTKDNVVYNDVNTAKAGVYHVTYRVSDLQGSSVEKTITVTVEEKAAVVDKDALWDLLEKYDGYEAGDYTKESWDAFYAAYQNASAVATDSDATQEEVDAAADALARAGAALTLAEKGEDPVTDGDDVRTEKPVDTGASTAAAPLTATVAIAAGAAILLIRKRRTIRG